ncbi:MAG: phosphatidate cytidylyltransferase [Gemmatimonadota bacterium]|nr:MAG: phosphatidate cytidylyltransferase [Gemmatimonadota bacterium]
MIGPKIFAVVAASFAVGALLMLLQRSSDIASSHTSWGKFAGYAVLLIALLGVAQLSGALYALSCGAIVALALNEFATGARIRPNLRYALGAEFLLLAAAALTAGETALYTCAVSVSLLALTTGALAHDPRRGVRQAIWSVIGIIAVATPGAHLLLLTTRPERFPLFAFLVLVVCCSDAFADLVGRRWPIGRGVLRASPEKSISGLAAGLGTALIMSLVLGAVTGLWPPWRAAVYGMCIAVAASTGDLIASSLKRTFNIKDFGTALGDHGGVLDRFDSLIFAAWPFYWLIRG